MTQFPDPVFALVIADAARQHGLALDITRVSSAGDREYARVELLYLDSERGRWRVRQHGGDPLWVDASCIRYAPRDKKHKPPPVDGRQVDLFNKETKA